MKHGFLACLAGLMLASPVEGAAVAPGPARIVRDAVELRAALGEVAAPATVRLLAGDYPLAEPLVIPDGVVLEGTGRMQLLEGRATGFADGPVTVIRAAAAFDGNLVTMGNQAALRNLQVVDQMPVRGAPLRNGNVVAVVSRAAGEFLSARIEDCEIVTGGAMGVTARGPVGHAIVVLTRSPALGEPGQPHDGASVALQVEHSVVRSTAVALFAVNFATRSTIDIALSGNLMAGSIVASGGTSRPALVFGSSVRLRSSGNLYQRSQGGVDTFGWMLFGGSSPHLQAPATPGPRDNVLEMQSRGDRIEGFRIGVLAAGARRRLEGSGPLEGNRAELDLADLRIVAYGEDGLGVALQGAVSGEGIVPVPGFPAGDRNLLHVRMTSVGWAGTPGRNRYAESFGTVTGATAETNRLLISGTAARFAEDNPGFEAPPGEYFDPPDAR